MADLVVHLGYPKTATTTFQQHVFPNHPDIDYLGKFIPSHRYRDCESFFQIDALYRKGRLGAVDVSALHGYIQRLRKESTRKVVLLSSESFLHPTAVDIATVIERVQQVFSPCKVWVTIREQLDALRSFHTMHGQHGQYFYIDALSEKEKIKFPIDFDGWINIQKRAPDKNVLGTLQYNMTITNLIQHFGKDNVHVSIYEELLLDRPSYVRKLSRSLGICEETTLGLLASHWANVSIRPSFWERLRGARRPSSPGTDSVAFLSEYYRTGNMVLSDLLELRLATYGYKT